MWVTPLSSLCKDGSSVSEDRRDLVCVRSDYNTNNAASYSEDMDFLVEVSMKNPNDTKTGELSYTVENDDAATADDSTDITGGDGLTITASPRWNVQIQSIILMPQEYNNSGELGFVYDYSMILEVDEVSGAEDTVASYLGSENLGDNFTLNETIDVSGMSPNTVLLKCDYNNDDGSLPYSYFYSDEPEGSVASLLDNLDMSCNQANAGDNVAFTYSGIDATMGHYPTETIYGSSLPVTMRIAAVNSITIFTPYSDILDANNSAEDGDGNIYYTLCNTIKITDFDPDGISGTSNFNSATESEKDNASQHCMTYYPNGRLRGSYSKYFKKVSGAYLDGDSFNQGKGVLTPGELFVSDLMLDN